MVSTGENTYLHPKGTHMKGAGAVMGLGNIQDLVEEIKEQ
jgi:hypothetical protein